MTKLYIKILFLVFAILVSRSALAGTPEEIRVTNVHGASFTVSWTSQRNEGGQVKYGTDPALYSNWQTANDDRGVDVVDDIHYVTVSDLSQNTVYYFEVISGGATDNNGGRFYTINSGPYAVPPPGDCTPAGKISKDLTLTQLAYNSVVYITILGRRGIEDSATESILYTSKSNGYWFIDLINFRNKSNTDFYPFACESNSISIEVFDGDCGSARITSIAKDFSISGELDSIILNPLNGSRGGTGSSGGCFICTDNIRTSFDSSTIILLILLISAFILFINAITLLQHDLKINHIKSDE